MDNMEQIKMKFYLIEMFLNHLNLAVTFISRQMEP